MTGYTFIKKVGDGAAARCVDCLSGSKDMDQIVISIICKTRNRRKVIFVTKQLLADRSEVSDGCGVERTT
jgi:hypothetical protein